VVHWGGLGTYSPGACSGHTQKQPDGGARQPAQRRPPTAQQTSGPEPATVDAAKLLQMRGTRDPATGTWSERTQSQPDGGARQPAQRKPTTAQPASGPEPATVRRDQIAPGARGPGPSSHINGHSHNLGKHPKWSLSQTGPTALATPGSFTRTPFPPRPAFPPWWSPPSA
jgi:hypothetical protein